MIYDFSNSKAFHSFSKKRNHVLGNRMKHLVLQNQAKFEYGRFDISKRLKNIDKNRIYTKNIIGKYIIFIW